MILKQVIRYPGTTTLEATWVNQEGVSVKCRAYDGSQMAELRNDLGADLPRYVDLIMQIEAEYVPPTPPQPVEVTSVSMAQARAALFLNGVNLDEIPAIFEQMPDPQKTLAKIDWEFRTTVQRDNPLVLFIQGQKHWSDQFVNDLFLQASTL